MARARTSASHGGAYYDLKYMGLQHLEMGDKTLTARSLDVSSGGNTYRVLLTDGLDPGVYKVPGKRSALMGEKKEYLKKKEDASKERNWFKAWRYGRKARKLAREALDQPPELWVYVLSAQDTWEMPEKGGKGYSLGRMFDSPYKGTVTTGLGYGIGLAAGSMLIGAASVLGLALLPVLPRLGRKVYQKVRRMREYARGDVDTYSRAQVELENHKAAIARGLQGLLGTAEGGAAALPASQYINPAGRVRGSS